MPNRSARTRSQIEFTRPSESTGNGTLNFMGRTGRARKNLRMSTKGSALILKDQQRVSRSQASRMLKRLSGKSQRATKD